LGAPVTPRGVVLLIFSDVLTRGLLVTQPVCNEDRDYN